MLTRRAQLAGKGSRQGGGGGRGLAFSLDHRQLEQRQSKQHQAGDYLSKAPFKGGGGLDEALQAPGVRTPRAQGLISGVGRLVF